MINEISKPELWSIWQHRNGNYYRVVMVTNVNTKYHFKYPITVIYENTHNGSQWSRPLNDWHRSMTEVNE